MTVYEFFIRLMLSLLLGTLIGIERQINEHSIGIRTNILVCLGTTMFTLFPFTIGYPDNLRVTAQIVTGVGFLGTGIIFKDGTNVRGVNTAATIWCSAAIGILSGAGNHIYAIVATIVLIVSNIIFRPIARRLTNVYIFGDSYNYYQIFFTCQKSEEYNFRDFLLKEIKDNKFQMIDLMSDEVKQDKIEIKSVIRFRGKGDNELIESFIKTIGLNNGIASIGWKSLDNS